MSFWLDWWLLFLLGFGIHVIVKYMGKSGKISIYNLKWIKRIMMLGVLGFFYLISGSLLAGFTLGTESIGDEIGPHWMGWLNDSFFGMIKRFFSPYYALHPAATSTEFMFSSGQQWLRELLNIQFDDLSGLVTQPFYLFIAILIFAIYPYIIFLGTYMAELMIGSKFGKNAIWKIAWPLIMLILLIVVPIIMYYSLQNSIVWESISILICISELVIILIFLLDYLLILRKK